MSHFGVALIFFILGFWFAGARLWYLEDNKQKKDTNKQKSKSFDYSFDSEGRPLDD